MGKMMKVKRKDGKHKARFPQIEIVRGFWGGTEGALCYRFCRRE
jgi:hypothetical protein